MKYVGVDIGGTNLKAVADESGNAAGDTEDEGCVHRRP